MRDLLVQRADPAIQLLRTLVDIDSGTGELDGAAKVVELVEARWARLGFSTTTLRTSAGFPVLRAERLVDQGRPAVLLLLHLDTVFPGGTAASRPFTRSGDRAFGPGVADMKGGAVVALMAVEAALQVSGLEHTNLVVLCNTDEETGSVASRGIIEDTARRASLALVYEPARPDGSIVVARRGLRRYRLTVRGRAAHTGVEPWAGANAVVALAGKIASIDALDDRDAGLSVTVSRVAGGTRINVVPDLATADIDARIWDGAAGAAMDEQLSDIALREDVPGTTGALELLSDRPPMAADSEVEGVVDLYRRAAAAVGVPFSATATGGGSDGCFTSACGVPTVDGLGPVGGGYHTESEYADLPSLTDRAAMSALVLSALDRTSSGDVLF